MFSRFRTAACSATTTTRAFSKPLLLPRCPFNIRTNPTFTRRTLTTTTAAGPGTPSDNAFIHLATRGLLEIRGKDSSKFLQGLITNHMPRIENGGTGFLAAFLSPKGRVMYDVFVHPIHNQPSEDGNAYLIECDARALPELHRHIARFVLRSKVKLVGVTEAYDVFSIFGKVPGSEKDDLADLQTSALSADQQRQAEEGVTQKVLGNMNASVGLRDSRADGLMGYRVIVPKGQPLALPDSFRKGTLEEYHVRRILNGVPEGIDDFIADASLPLECNLDYMNGVDFRKGCYVGQELTIRTYHKGITRKRVLPVQYYLQDEPEPQELSYHKSQQLSVPPQSELHPAKLASKDGSAETVPASSTSAARPVRASGKSGSNLGNIGLALMKLDQVEDGGVFQVMDREGVKIRAKAFIPTWWPKQATDDKGESEST